MTQKNITFLKIKLLIAVSIFISFSFKAQVGLGLPSWLLSTNHPNNVNTTQSPYFNTDWKPSYLFTSPSSPTVSTTSTTVLTDSIFLNTNTAYDECGNIKFHVVHTGRNMNGASAGRLQLMIVKADGTELTNSTTRMDACPQDNEVEVFALPDTTNKWMILYQRNYWPGDGGPSVRASQILYSIVTINPAGSLIFIKKDLRICGDAFLDNCDGGKAVSIIYSNGSPAVNKRYFYVRRGSSIDLSLSNTLIIDQYQVDKNGIIETSPGSGTPLRFSSTSISKQATALDARASLELNEAGSLIKLATLNIYDGGTTVTSTTGTQLLYITMADHTKFGLTLNTDYTRELIPFAELAIVPSDNTSDAIVNYNTANWNGSYKRSVDFINGTANLNRYICNYHRKISDIEFSPNGKFLYTTYGGYSQSSTEISSHLTYISQIDLETRVKVPNVTPYRFPVRLKTQEVSGLSVSTSGNHQFYGIGNSYINATNITHANYISWKGTARIEKTPEGKLYFTKLNSSSLFCLENPDQVFTNIDFTPVNLFNGQSSNVNLPAYTSFTPNAFYLPDAVDQDNYASSYGNCNISIPCENCIGSFAPDILNGAGQAITYILSTWVKESGATTNTVTYNNAQIFIDFINSSNTVISSAGPFTGSGQIIDSWQRVENSFTIPTNTVRMELRLKSVSGNSYFDDIRIFPKDGSMKSYVYDASSLRLVAELDERNYATFYEYDEEGKLMRIKKETERGIMTIQETKTSTKKNP